MGEYRAGVAVRDTTPSAALLAAGIWLWGYGNRDVACFKVDQDLSTRALAIQDSGGRTIVLVSIDIGALDPAMTARIKARVASVFPALSAEYVCLNASHTHSAPVGATIPTWQLGVGYVDGDYGAFLENQVVGVIMDALNSMRPVALSWARGATDIGFDRHPLPDGDNYDPTLDVLRVTGTSGQTMAVVFSTACHPTAHPNSDGISADFPGFARTQIEAQFGGVGLFLQGYAGTCNPKDVAGNDASLGQTLAADVIGLLQGPMDDLSGRIDAWLMQIDLPLQHLDRAILPGWMSWAQANPHTVAGLLVGRWAAYMQSLGDNIPGSLPTPFQAMRIGTSPGECYIVASGHEPATDFGPRVRALWRYPRVTLAGYSNSQLSYIPSTQVLLNPDDRAVFPDASRMTNYEGGDAFLWYGQPGLLTTDVDNVFLQGHVALKLFAERQWATIIYGIVQQGQPGSGQLLWYKHVGFQDGADQWLTTQDPKGYIGEGWGQDNFVQVFSGGNGVLYAIDKNGNLLWYKHLGFQDGADKWLTTQDPKGYIGEGWGADNFVRVFPGGNGVIYAINKNGQLLWYKHLGFRDGADRWQTSPDPKGYIGEGWGQDNFASVFSGGDGILYAVTKSGRLLWYKHLGFEDGTDKWLTTRDPKGYIGEGWGEDNFVQVFSGGNGILYAVNKNGHLLWYKHRGFEDGTDRWLTTRDPKGYIGEGWGLDNFARVVCGGNGVA